MRRQCGEEEVPTPSKHTLQWLVDKYVVSAAFKGLRDTTQTARHNILKVACKTGGKLILSQIDRKMIAAGRDRRADTPFAAISYLKVMGYLFEWAVDSGFVNDNPAKGVKKPKAKSQGFPPWTVTDIEN